MFQRGPRWFQKQIGETENLPEEDVTEEEFIKLLVGLGMEHARAKSQASFAKGLGSRIRIDNKMMGIKQ